MRVTVNRRALVDILRTLAPIVPRRGSLPILDCVKINVNGVVGLTVTNLDTTVTRTLPVDPKAQPGAIAVPFKPLLDMVRSSTADEVVLYVATKGKDKYTLHVTEPEAEYSFGQILMGLDPAEFPIDATTETYRDPFSVAGDVFAALAQAAPFASTEESRPILNGVLWELRPDGHTVVTTNGHRLMKIQRPWTGDNRMTFAKPAKKGSPTMQAWILPTLACEVLASLIPLDGRATVSSRKTAGYSEGGWLRIVTPELCVVTRLIEGPYPHYEQVIPRETARVARLETKPLLAALKRLRPSTSKATRKVALDFSADGGVTLTAKEPDTGTATLTLPCTYTGEPIRIGVSLDYLSGLVKGLDCDTVTWAFQADSDGARGLGKFLGNEKATVLRPEQGDAVLALLMPMRILGD